MAVGRDAWAIGAQVNLPFGGKYDALAQEARWKHAAAHAGVEEAEQRYDALLLESWEQARTAQATQQLYLKTMLPQAREALQAAQKAFPLGTVEFDRVIANLRQVLALELGYHRARGQLATAIARIRQLIGRDLAANPGQPVESSDLPEE